METKSKETVTAPCCTDAASVVTRTCTPPPHRFELVQNEVENDVETRDETNLHNLPRQTQPKYIAIKGLT